MNVEELYQENIRLRLKNERLIEENLRLIKMHHEYLEDELNRNAQYNLIKELISSGRLEMKEVENGAKLKMYLIEINSPYKFCLYEYSDNDLVVLIKKLQKELKNGN